MPTTLQGIGALSERQREILRLTAGHHQVKEIARLLKISENTVKTHMIEARRRLGGVTTKQAVRLLLAQEENAGIIPEGGDPKEVIPSAADVMPVWFHEHAPYPHRRINDPEEIILQRLVAPNQGKKIQEMVEELKSVNRTLGPREATYQLVALTAWLAEDGASSGGD